MSTEQSPLLQKHRRAPLNVNRLHRAEQAAAGFNQRLAIGITKAVGSMPTAYSFVILAVVGLLGILGILSPLVALLVAWTSQTLIQLVLLPVIMVGQNVLGHHAEMVAEEEYNTTQATRADAEQILARLDALTVAVQALKEVKL
jgi:uncharacterized membrane protein